MEGCERARKAKGLGWCTALGRELEMGMGWERGLD